MDRLEHGTLHTGQQQDDDDDDAVEDWREVRMQSWQKACRHGSSTGERKVERQRGHDSALPMLYSSDWMLSSIWTSLLLSLLLALLLALSFPTRELLVIDSILNFKVIWKTDDRWLLIVDCWLLIVDKYVVFDVYFFQRDDGDDDNSPFFLYYSTMTTALAPSCLLL